jgi:hypothetical protein
VDSADSLAGVPQLHTVSSRRFACGLGRDLLATNKKENQT